MSMTSEDLILLMADSAENAIITTKEEFNITLDGSEESINLVDDIILSWLAKYKAVALEENAVFTICNIYGAYIGEIFRKKIGGEWKYDESDPDAPYVVLNYAGNSYAFAGVCYQRLVNDSEVSIQQYYRQAVSNNIQ
ncbi:hypothetical protein RS130_17590 [Paraglaciecola aquimarina]|uniref:DUF3806 domain-containing protein n=1 Tax=Paraglaciecola aquimarina TaxID=1235557 RepID=A0ABU3SZT2_9ALTE|nr:hypothetical protein [Paraglaciecola aquimarina]MDU0355472.1 hypothetical protein [Paraglaciecola aquimarina]